MRLDPGAAGDAAAVAREVFRDDAFWWKRIETATVSTSWLARIFEAIAEFLGWIMRGVGDWLAALLRRLFSGFGGSFEGAGLIVVFLVGILLALVLWRLSRVVYRWLGAAEPEYAPRAVALETLAESSEVLEQALQALRDGLYAESIRLALLALIARLEKQGLLRYDTSRTNREYQRELRPFADLAAGFGRLARIHERVWYGGKAAGRVEAEQAIDLCRTLIAGEGLAPE